MSNAESILKQLSEDLDDLLVQDGILPMRRNEIQGGGGRFGMGMMIMVKEPTRIDFRIDIYPREIEEPHFKISYHGETCRFKIEDCEPMKAEAQKGVPTQIKKIMKQIKQVWSENKNLLAAAWDELRPSDQHHGHQKVR